MKIYTFLVTMVIMIAFLEFMGFDTTMDSAINAVGIFADNTNPTLDFTSSTFYLNLFGTAGLLIASGFTAAILVGFMTRQFDWKIVLVPFFVWFIATFITTGIGIAGLTEAGWLKKIITLIFGGMTLGLMWGIVEYYGGSDQ